MTSWKLTFEQIRQRPEISEIFSALERGFEKFGLDFFLAGAMAKDIWMLGIHEKTTGRITRDIDMAVLISNRKKYSELKNYLIAHEGFTPSKENAFALIWENKLKGKMITPVDLMPFGDIADADGKVTIEGFGFTSIELPGFQEIFETGLPEMELGGKHKFKVCTLPGIVILKLIAWDDRPEMRKKDIIDISEILEHYFDMTADEIYDSYSSLFDWENSSLPQISATVLGMKMREIAARNKKIWQRLEKILAANTRELNESKMAVIMAENRGNTAEDNFDIIQKMKEGFLK